MRKIEEITNGVKSAKENITKHQEALKKLYEIDEKTLTEEQKEVLKVFKGELDSATLKTKDLHVLEKGSREAGAYKIMRKHYPETKTGGLNDDEVLNISKVINEGELIPDSFEKRKEGIRYAYEWDNNGVKLRVVVDKNNDKRSVFDYYSNRNLAEDKESFNLTGGGPNPKPHQVENNNTEIPLTSQEKPLSILEKSQLEKEKKLESERLAKEQKERLQKIKDKEQAELNAKIREQKNATLGKSELDRQIAKSENIPYKELENAPKSSVSLNDDEIHPLKFVIVNKSDLKPNFKNTGTQTRTAIDSKKIEEIASNFDPKLILGRGGFDDLPIILHDGQVIAGNHRTQGMLNFNAESRKRYEQAIKENFNIDLKPDELLVRMPENELDDKEIFKLASKSNENRANSFSDTLLSAMSSYNDKLKHLPTQFESDSVENLANQVARVLEKDAKIPSQTQIENANLALLSRYATNTANNSFLEVFDNAYKHLDREQFKAFKEMFAHNSANFHNLNNDTTLKNFTIAPYLTDALDTTAKMLESGNRADNFAKLAHDIDYLVKTTDKNGVNDFIKHNKDTYQGIISELLGSSFARFLRLENPTAQFYEFLKQAKDRMIENAADIFAGTSKPISQINVFDFIKYAIESGKSSKESRELLDLLPELEKKFNAYELHLKDEAIPKEWGKNYSEFKGDGVGAINKLLEVRSGHVEGAFHKQDLGDIDLVWGKGGKDGYGLEHILEKREKQYTRLGLNAEQIKQRTDELLKSIPEVIEKGTPFKDDLGRFSVQLNDIKVGLNNQWFGNDLKNHLIVTSYEKDEKVLRELETRSPLSNDYKGNSNYSALNLNENNNTEIPLTSQEKPLKSAKENITNHEKALQKLYEIDEKTLTDEQKEVLKVFKGELDSAIIKGRDLEDLYLLESGVKKYGARKIIRRHYGEEKLGGVNNDKILNMGEVIKNGSVVLESFEKRPDRIRYAYEWDNNGVKLRVVVDDLENKNKIFDFYSDRNTTGAGPIQDPPAKNNVTKESPTSQGAKR